MTPAENALLKAEIANDPTALGYAVMTDEQIAAALNLVRATITFKRKDVSQIELLECIDTRDLKANPTVLEGSWLESVLQFPSVRLANDDNIVTRVRQNLNRLVNDTNGTQTRLNALALRTGSRAEQVLGQGVRPLDFADVQAAKAS